MGTEECVVDADTNIGCGRHSLDQRHNTLGISTIALPQIFQGFQDLRFVGEGEESLVQGHEWLAVRVDA